MKTSECGKNAYKSIHMILSVSYSCAPLYFCLVQRDSLWFFLLYGILFFGFIHVYTVRSEKYDWKIKMDHQQKKTLFTAFQNIFICRNEKTLCCKITSANNNGKKCKTMDQKSYWMAITYIRAWMTILKIICNVECR